MPVKKTSARKIVRKAAPATKTCSSCLDTKSLFHGNEFTRRIFITLLAIFLVYIIFWLGTLIRNNIQEYNHIGQMDSPERTISVTADAKITATPDIAMTTIGMIVEGQTVAAAQEKNTTVMNSLIEQLRALGIASEDIQTANYNIYPRYNFTEEEGRTLDGYEVNQSVQVKIRDLDKANSVIALAGQVGANSVSGLQFTIDDREVYLTQAREKALEKAFAKAGALERTLGIDVVGIVSFNEFEGGTSYGARATGFEDIGFGGAGAPSVEPGSMDVILGVNVIFEIQ